jgi:hypothetical protein
MLQTLATTEDIADILNLYAECFKFTISDPIQLEGQHTAVGFQFGHAVGDADPGVEIESSLPPDVLAMNLGFTRGLPLLFNTYRHDMGLTPWADPRAFEDNKIEGDAAFTPVSLRWHQLAGVHSVLRRILSKEPSPGRLGFLIAD